MRPGTTHTATILRSATCTRRWGCHGSVRCEGELQSRSAIVPVRWSTISYGYEAHVQVTDIHMDLRDMLFISHASQNAADDTVLRWIMLISTKRLLDSRCSRCTPASVKGKPTLGWLSKILRSRLHGPRYWDTERHMLRYEFRFRHRNTCKQK